MSPFLNLVLGLASLASEPTVTPDEALRTLVEGNVRFATQEMHHPHVGEGTRRETAKTQRPFVAIVTCADSRVSPEIVFDQGLGDVFVVRSAGNTVDDDGLASLEYAVDHLGVGLIVVMGHSKCGAVGAAVAATTHTDHEEGEPEFYVPRLVAKISPAVRYSMDGPGDLLTNSIRANERMVAAGIRKAEGGLGRALKEGQLRVVGAVYDIATNKVSFDGEDAVVALAPPRKAPAPPAKTAAKEARVAIHGARGSVRPAEHP